MAGCVVLFAPLFLHSDVYVQKAFYLISVMDKRVYTTRDYLLWHVYFNQDSWNLTKKIAFCYYRELFFTYVENISDLSSRSILRLTRLG